MLGRRSGAQRCCGMCRGSLAFSNSSEAATDSSSGVTAGRGMYGLTMGEGGSDGIGRGGQSARRGGMTMFEAAPEDARKAAKSNIYGTMAFSDVEKENEVRMAGTPHLQSECHGVVDPNICHSVVLFLLLC